MRLTIIMCLLLIGCSKPQPALIIAAQSGDSYRRSRVLPNGEGECSIDKGATWFPARKNPDGSLECVSIDDPRFASINEEQVEAELPQAGHDQLKEKL